MKIPLDTGQTARYNECIETVTITPRKAMDANMQSVMKNYRATGSAPYGYRYAGRPPQLVEWKEEQQTLRIILEMRDGGYSALDTAERLNAAGLLPRLATQWTPGTVRVVLTRWRGKALV